MPKIQTLTRNHQRAIEKYGVELCVKAFWKNEKDGLGANTIAHETAGLTNTNAADAAINAGRWLVGNGYGESYDPAPGLREWFAKRYP